MDPFLGEIRLVGFNFAPQGWAFCNGQILSISSNTALYSLLGTYYGGNGTQTFALPNLQSRVPVCMGQGQGLTAYPIGMMAGAENVQLNSTQMPTHNHGMVVDASPASDTSPNGGNIAQVNTGTVRAPVLTPSFTTGNPAAPATLNAGTIQNQGGGQGHPNIQPVLALNYIIALEGIYPSRS